MKKVIASLLFIFAIGAASAQSMSDEVTYLRNIFGKEKKDLIGQFMNLRLYLL